MDRERLPESAPESAHKVVKGIDIAMHKNMGDTIQSTPSTLRRRGNIPLSVQSVSNILAMLANYEECNYDIDQFSDANHNSWIITKDD